MLEKFEAWSRYWVEMFQHNFYILEPKNMLTKI